MTAKSLLESYLPPSLRLTEEQLKAEEKKLQTGNEPPTPVKKNNVKIEGDNDTGIDEKTCLTDEEESEFIRSSLDSIFSDQFRILDAVSDFLLSVFQKFSHRKWPLGVSYAFVRFEMSLSVKVDAKTLVRLINQTTILY